MTKTIKKSFIAVLMMLLAVCAVFATMSVKSSFADEIPANVTAFNEYVAAFDSYKDSDFTNAVTLKDAKEEIFGDTALAQKYIDARVLYTENMTAEEKAAVAAEVKALYDKITLVFSDSIKVSSYNNADLLKALRGTGVKYSMKAVFVEISTLYEDMTGNEKTYTTNSMKPAIFFDDVKTALTAIETQAALAQTAIGNIEYLVGENMKVPAEGETGAIVYDSKASMDNALAALNKIYKTKDDAGNDVYVAYANWDATEKTALSAIINNIAKYDAAVEAWKGLQAKADEVAEEINDLFNGDYKATGSYKNKTAINTASARYEALNTTHNDLRNLVNQATKDNLKAMKDALKAQEDNIATANTKIAALIDESTVDTANGVYTTACKAKINEVTGYIISDNFDQYILDNKATIFTNYAKYEEIDNKYNAMAKAITDLKEKLMKIKENSSNVFADFEAAKAIYGAFVPNQVTAFEGEVIDPAITYSYTSYDGIKMNLPCPNYKELYIAVRGHAEDVASAAAKIIAKINALDLTIFDLAHYQAATAVDTIYKAAPEAVQKAVSNYDKLDKYLAKFAEILAGAKQWAAMELPEVVSYADCIENGLVYKKIAAWNGLDDLLKEYVAATTEAEYKNAYVKFMNAKKASELILAAVSTAKTAVSAVETVSDPFNLAVGTATDEFVAHVNAATVALEALKGEKTATAEDAACVGTSIKYNAEDAIAAVFSNDTATEKVKYENYLKAVAKLPSFEVEAAINALFTGTTLEEAKAVITLASEYDVKDADDKVIKFGIASLLAKVEEIKVRDYYYDGTDGKLDFALAALNALKAEYDAFIAEVKKVAATKGDAEAIIKIDLDNLASLNAEYVAFVGSPEDAHVVEYLKEAKEILDTLVTRNASLVVDFVAKINSVIAKDAAGKIAEGKEDIIWVQNVYNNFTDSQKAQPTGEEKPGTAPVEYKTVEEKYAEFADISKKFQYSEYFKDAVNNLEMNFNADGKLTHEAYIQIKTLLAMYNIAPADIQALLAEPYGKLTEIVKKYDAEGAVFTDINKVAADLEAAKSELKGLIEGIDDQIGKLKEADDANDAAIKAAVTSLNAVKKSLEDRLAAIDTTLNELKAKDTLLEGKINDIVKAGGSLDTMKAAIEEAYKAADKDIKDSIKAANEALAGENKAREEADKALQNAIEAASAAIKAETEAREAETKKLHNAIVTISIIFSIVLVALVACVVVLFLKKRA